MAICYLEKFHHLCEKTCFISIILYRMFVIYDTY